MQKVIVITGPTAVGKTKLSVEIAKRLHTDIINADAYLVYKKMNIGTAKPTIEERERVVHHLIDILEPSEEFSIADYQTMVRNIISKMSAENKIPLMVGGSGLYIDSVIKKYQFHENKRSDDKYKEYTNEQLYHLLKKLDLEASQKIHLNNRKRLIRAIELAQLPLFKSSRSQGKDLYYNVLCIFLNDDREKLYQRINERVDLMIEKGLVDEIKEIGIDNFSKTASAAIGYKEIIDYLRGNITRNESIELIKKNTRHYAKRQFTWFRNKTSSVIVNICHDEINKTVDEVMHMIYKFLC